MLDLLFEPAKMLIEGGVEKLRRSAELKNLKIAIQDRLLRELAFNLAILDEAIKESRKDGDGSEAACVALVSALRTSAFDAINDGPIPASLLISDGIEKAEWPKYKGTDQYNIYLQGVSDLVGLVDRAYHRIHIAKTFASCGKFNVDLSYIRFMICCLIKEIKPAPDLSN